MYLFTILAVMKFATTKPEITKNQNLLIYLCLSIHILMLQFDYLFCFVISVSRSHQSIKSLPPLQQSIWVIYMFACVAKITLNF